MNNEITVNALIRDNLFRIPIYQRSYVWTEKNWDALWQDINDVVSGKYRKHFIGSIINSAEDEGEDSPINDDDSNQNNDDYRLVIDGQQRITTFTLIVAAVCYYLAKQTHESAKLELRDFKRGYLFKEVDDSKEPTLRLRPASSNETFFNSILDPLRLEQQLPDSFISKESQIYAAFNYFKDKIEKYADDGLLAGDGSEERRIKRVTALVTSAFDKMRLIELKLEKGDDAQRIFECMNWRGQPLEQSDLIRNYALQGWSRAKRVQFYNDYWVKVENAAKDQYAKKKIDEDKVPEFFHHYLSMRENQSIRERDIFSTFRDGEKYDCIEQGKRSPDKMEQILQEILRFAGHYNRILNSRKTNPDKVFAKEVLRHLWYVNQIPQASTVHPFLLRLLDDYADRKIIGKDTLVACLEIVQSYMVRRVFCSFGNKSFNKIFPPLYRRTFQKTEYWDDKADNGSGCLKKGISAESYIACVQRGLGARTKEEEFPSDEEFRDKYLEFNLYRNKMFCRYILLRLETKLSGNKPDSVTNEDDVTIEHIYPQTPNKDWAGISDGGLMHTIGNLTFTALNSEMGNKSFSEKRKHFACSTLKLNQYLANLDPRIRWNGEKIHERAGALYKLMKNLWQDIPSQFRENVMPEDFPIRDLDIDDFLDGNKPRRISYVVFDNEKNRIDGSKYAGRKQKGSWQQNESNLKPANETQDGIFYDRILRRLYNDHEGSFKNTPLGEKGAFSKKGRNCSCLFG